MAGTLKFSRFELGIRGENQTVFRIKSYKELSTHPSQGLHGHLQTSEDGQTLVWTLVCGCAMQLLASLWDAVGVSWLTQAWSERAMDQQKEGASLPCGENRSSVQLHKQEPCSQVRG